MKILIIGSGAVGGFIGARLLEKKLDVAFLVRPERKVRLVTRGLQLRSQFGAFRQPVHAITADEIGGAYDLVVPTVRAHQYEEALLLAAPAIGTNTILMPMVEGARHLENIPGAEGPRIIGAVLEARTTLDADGIMSQRTPAAELHIGALRPGDAPLAAELAKLFAGRGINLIESGRVRAKCWERFGFVAAGIATAYLKQRPLRDAVRFAHGPAHLQDLLREAYRIGSAAGFAPDMIQVGKYERAFTLVGRPVAAPAMIGDDGAAGDEALFLLAEMVAIARRVRVGAYLFNVAWKSIAKLPEITSPADDVTVAQA